MEYILTLDLDKKNLLIGQEYGFVIKKFINIVGTVSKYNLPWKALDNKIRIDTFQINDYLKKATDIYILIDSYSTPIYKIKQDEAILKFKGFIEIDFDFYLFDEDFNFIIIHTGLFEKETFVYNPKR